MQTYLPNKNVHKARGKEPIRTEECPDCGSLVIFRTCVNVDLHVIEIEGECKGCGLTVA